ncbi:MAG: hypothetical protein ACK559_35055, partial [bacterium]
VGIGNHDPFRSGVTRGGGLDQDAVLGRLHLHEEIDGQPRREAREREAAGLREGGARQFVADRREPLWIDEQQPRLRHESLVDERGEALDGDHLRLPRLLGGELSGGRLDRRADDGGIRCRRHDSRAYIIEHMPEQGDEQDHRRPSRAPRRPAEDGR